MITGPDISHHQGAVDFTKVKAAGHAFVILKVTEGTGYIDPMFATNRARAHDAGLMVGLYHFVGSSTAKRIYDPTAEADFFAQVVGALLPGEFVAEDFEPYDYTNLAGRDLVAWSQIWLDRVAARLGCNPLIYMDRNNLAAHDWSPVAGAGRPLWLAVYDNSTAAPAVTHWSAAAMKQFTNRGAVPGIGGDVDLNVFYGDAATLAALGTSQEDDLNDTQAGQLAAIFRAVIMGEGEDPQGRNNFLWMRDEIAALIADLKTTVTGFLDIPIAYPVDIVRDGKTIHKAGETLPLRTLIAWQEPREQMDRVAVLDRIDKLEARLFPDKPATESA